MIFPGYGYSKISKINELKIDVLIEEYLRNRKLLKFLFLLIDSRHGLKDVDKEILIRLEEIINSKIIIIFTKVDKIKNQLNKNNLLTINREITEKFNKTFFNTSIKNSNDIFLLRKFLLKSIEK